MTKNIIRISFKLSSFVLNVFNRIETIVIQGKKNMPKKIVFEQLVFLGEVQKNENKQRNRTHDLRVMKQPIKF